jgi:hypothetical protein
MRGLEDPFNYAVIDPESWKDSIKTPIYMLLDELRGTCNIFIYFLRRIRQKTRLLR